MPNVQVLNLSMVKDEIDPTLGASQELGRNYVLVFVWRVHNATLQAIQYPESLSPADLRAVSFALDPVESERLMDEWMRQRIPVPLEIQDSPVQRYR
ncbi:MAG: hypothetical protein ABR529_12120 [Actinomycetota bacterium]